MCMLKDVDTFVSFSELQFWSHMCHKFLTLPQTLVTSTASAVSEGTKQQCFWCPDLCHKSHPMQLCLRHSQPSIWGTPLASSISGNQVKPPLTLDQSFMFPADLSFLNCKRLQKTVDPETPVEVLEFSHPCLHSEMAVRCLPCQLDRCARNFLKCVVLLYL